MYKINLLDTNAKSILNYQSTKLRETLTIAENWSEQIGESEDNPIKAIIIIDSSNNILGAGGDQLIVNQYIELMK